MDIQWNDRRTRQFVTNVGLITSDGPYGADVMSAEWTHHMSYSPCLIAVNIRGHDATALIFHNGKYWKMSGTVEKPPSYILEKINELGERYKK